MSGTTLHRHSDGGAPTPLARIVARNLRRLRERHNYTLERLSELADVNLLTLLQMEEGKGEPSVALAWRIAVALHVPFAALLADQAPRGTVLLRHEKTKLFVSDSLGLTSRPLFPADEAQSTEFYELRLTPNHREASDAHPSGTVEILHVAQGALEVTVGREPPHLVSKGDTLTFPADLPHAYRNLSDKPAQVYLVMTYAS